jgi:phospholipase C
MKLKSIYRIAMVLLFAFNMTAWAQIPRSRHVVVVVEENHSYESVIGNPAMPFLNELASSYGVATAYFANTHNSIPNYFWLTAGQPVTHDDNTRASFNVDNLARDLFAAGRTWKSYADSLPSAGYTGFNVFPYVKRHNPFAYFIDVANSPVQRLNLVPFSRFSSDLTNGQLPDFSFVVPNLEHDAHNGSLAAADDWLRRNIGPLLSSRDFQPGGDGLLIITFDESFKRDCRPGSCGSGAGMGGHVATIVAGPNVKRHFASHIFYQHQNLLKTVAEALGVSAAGAASRARGMTDFFRQMSNQ